MRLVPPFVRSLGINRSVASAVGFGLVAATIVIVAVRSDGAVASTVQLDDGSVWVTNERSGRVGRLNVQIDELDLAVAADAEVLVQDGRTVVFDGPGATTQKIDVVTATQSGNPRMPAVLYQVGGDVGLVADPETGFIWVGPSAGLVGASYPEEPDGAIQPGSRTIVTRGETGDGAGGAIFVFDEQGWYELEVDDRSELVRSQRDDLEAVEDLPSDADEQESADGLPPPLPNPVYDALPAAFSEIEKLSAVGDTPVILFSGGRVSVGGAVPVLVPGDGVILQQPSPTAESVIVGSSAGLFELGVRDDSIEQITEADAEAGAPVRVGPCVYGGWSGDKPKIFKRCGDQVVIDGLLPGAGAGAAIVFRVNGRNVAINQPVNGNVWTDHDGELAEVGNWDDVEPDQVDDSNEVESSDTEVTTQRTCLEGDSAQPTAGDDELGARPRQTILDVLYNDDDANCEPIAIVEIEPSSGPWGELAIIDDGQHVLYSPSDEWVAAAEQSPQPVTFAYIVSDAGGNRSAEAAVSLIVKSREVGDVRPELRPKSDGTSREMRSVVEEGRAITYDATAEWWDPDGDELRVLQATPDVAGEVSVTSTGAVRYAAYGVAPGVQRVQVTVSDGQLKATEPLDVTIQPTGTILPPDATDDFLTLTEGASQVIFPLANDSDPNEDVLELRPVWETNHDGQGVIARQVDDGVRVEAVSAGTYTLDYEASDGAEATAAKILVRVLGPSSTNSAPVAVPDTVRTRAGRVVNVDVLANDIDSDGDLLAVSTVTSGTTGSTDLQLKASVVDRRLLQIQALPGLEGAPAERARFVITYTVTDGGERDRAADAEADQAASASAALRSIGTVTVVIEPEAQDQPPLLVADDAIVRTGDVVVVPVLRNDTDPDGDEIQLISVDANQAAELETTGAGIVWAQDRSVAFQGGEPGQVSVLYTVEAGGRQATSEVSFTIVGPPSAENPNQPPQPPDVQLRAIHDGTVRLNVPLSGVDADGDSVVLLDRFDAHVGASAGNRISLDPENPGTIIFEAGPEARSPSRDRFEYRVQDTFGAIGTGIVEVLVIADDGAPPVAHDDVLRGRPGRTLSVSVLANDTSPQDSRLSLAESPFFDPEGRPVDTPTNRDAVAVLDQTDKDARGRINFLVPTDVTATLSEHYRISDGRNDADAYVRITPDPDTPNVAPVANDDHIEISDVVGRAEARAAVLDNDFDPDNIGVPLILSVADNQRATVDGNEIVVKVDEQARTVIYKVKDVDGGIGFGQVFVPGNQNHPPVLNAAGRNKDLRIIEAGAADPLRIVINEVVEDPDGETGDIRLTDTEIQDLSRSGGVRRTDDNTAFDYTPPDTLQSATTVRIEFEVTDRPELPLADQLLPTCGCRSTLVIEVQIEGSTPPRLLGIGSVNVPQLDESVGYDLSRIVIDDDDDPLTFALSDSNDFGNLTVSQDGSQLTIVSTVTGDDAPSVGDQIPIFFTVSDGKYDDVEGRLNATIIATNRGRPAAATFSTIEAVRDESTSLPNLLTGASNPFPDRPLTLSASRSDFGAHLECDEAGDCTFVADTAGTFTVTYTLIDAVGQTATGTITIVVKGQPLAPGIPRVQSVGDRQVVLAWDPADPQGGTITEYEVRIEGTDQTKSSVTPGLRFDGLTNATDYRFSVVATNELGEGERSGISSIGTPDRVPSQPENLRFPDYDDGQLSLSWDPPSDAGEYSAITQYEVTIGGRTVKSAGTSFTVEDLTNGTDYTFRVRAQNRAKTDQGWGASTESLTTERPSRYPDPPTNVQAVNTGDGGAPRLTVSWAAPAFNGGRPITQFEVCPTSSGGAVVAGDCQRTGSGASSATFAASRNTTLQFSVRAFNATAGKRNDSDRSGPSSPVTAVGNPSAPTISASSPVGDKQLNVVYTASGDPSGCSSESPQYSINGGASWQSGSVFGGLTNGTEYTIVARTVLGSGCGTPGVVYSSPVSNAVPQTPYGPLRQPTLNAVVNGRAITWTWNTNRGDDGRPDWDAEISGACAGHSFVPDPLPPTGSIASLFPWGSTWSCTISVSAGGRTLAAAAPATTPPEWELVSRTDYIVDCTAGIDFGGWRLFVGESKRLGVRGGFVRIDCLTAVVSGPPTVSTTNHDIEPTVTNSDGIFVSSNTFVVENWRNNGE